MDSNTPAKDQLSRVLEIIQEIAEKSADGDYIYRGEPECYDEVSSTLYRKHSKINAEHFNIEVVQEEILEASKRYTNKTDDLEILTELQHYGGATNLIDFTADCHIAIFFACESNFEQDGRIILLQKTNPDIIKPQSSVTRINAQKSIFVRPPSGFIEPDDTINIPKDIKQSVLNHLHKYHGISTEVIYNDLHGFIRYQDIHQGAYAECYTGLAYQDEGNHSNAIEHYSRAIEFNPQMVAAYYNRGTCYAYQNKYDRAISDYDKVIELDPDDAAAYHNRGTCYRSKGEYDRAIIDYDKAIELEPDDAAAYYNRGACYFYLNKYDRAIVDYDKAIKLKPDYTAAYYNRGTCYYDKSEYDRAIVDYDKAIELEPDDAAAYYNRGHCYHDKGEYDRAIVDYDKAIELEPDDAAAYYNRGHCYHDKGEYDRAIADFNKAIEINPQLAKAHYNRGMCWLHLQKWQEAKKDLTVARNMGMDIVAAFRNEQEISVPLPPDIAAMLTP